MAEELNKDEVVPIASSVPTVPITIEIDPALQSTTSNTQIEINNNNANTNTNQNNSNSSEIQSSSSSLPVLPLASSSTNSVPILSPPILQSTLPLLPSIAPTTSQYSPTSNPSLPLSSTTPSTGNIISPNDAIDAAASSMAISTSAILSARTHPMSVSSMISNDGSSTSELPVLPSLNSAVGNNYSIANPPVLPPLSNSNSTLPSIPLATSNSTALPLSKPINSTGVNFSSIQKIPSFRPTVPPTILNLTPLPLASGSTAAYGSPKTVIPLPIYGGLNLPAYIPKPFPPSLPVGAEGPGSIGGNSSPAVIGEKERLEALIGIPTVAKSERSYPPLPSAFARESPYSTWPSASEREAQQQQQQQSNYGNSAGAGGDKFNQQNRNSISSHRSSNSSTGIPSIPSTSNNTTNSAPGTSTGSSTTGFNNWPGNTSNGGASSAPIRDYAYFNDIARSSEQQLQNQREHSSLPPLPSSKLPPPIPSSSSTSTNDRRTSPFSNNIAPPLSAPSSSSRPGGIDPYNNNSSINSSPFRRYPPVPPPSNSTTSSTTTNPFGNNLDNEIPRADSTGYTPSRASALLNGTNGNMNPLVRLPPQSNSTTSTPSNANGGGDRHKRRRSEGNALHDSMNGTNSNSNGNGLNNSSIPAGFTSSTESIRPSKVQIQKSSISSSTSNSSNTLPILNSTNSNSNSTMLPSNSGLNNSTGFIQLSAPPFTIVQQRLAEIKPNCLKVFNEPVLNSVKNLFNSTSNVKESEPTSTPVITTPTTSTIPITSETETKPIAVAEEELKSLPRPFLGTNVYDPFIDPSKLLDGSLLMNGIGGYIEVGINVGWLEGWSFELGNPENYNGNLIGGKKKNSSNSSEIDNKGKGKATTAPAIYNTTTTEAEEVKQMRRQNLQNRIPLTMWDLEPIQNRKIWGTDIYTDDSDILTICLHSGWLRMGPLKEVELEEGEGLKGKGKSIREERTLLVKLAVLPTLVRYQGCTRQGIKSRSWGNGHDGVSLMIEDITLIDTRIKPKGRKWIKFTAGQIANTLSETRSIGPIKFNSNPSNPSTKIPNFNFNNSSSSSSSTSGHVVDPASSNNNGSSSNGNKLSSALNSNAMDVEEDSSVGGSNLNHVRDTFILDPILSKRVFIS